MLTDPLHERKLDSNLDKSEFLKEVEYTHYKESTSGDIVQQLVPNFNIQWKDHWFPKPSEERYNNSQKNLNFYKNAIIRNNGFLVYSTNSKLFISLQQYPWYLSYSTGTGFPNALRSVSSFPIPKNQQEAIDSAKSWLSQPENIAILTGGKDYKIFFPMPPRVVVIKPDKKTINYHIIFQHYVNKIAVSGSKIILHINENDPRIFITSSFVYIPDEFINELNSERKLSEDDQKLISKKIINHYSKKIKYSKLNIILSKEPSIISFCGEIYVVKEAFITDKRNGDSWSIFISLKNGTILGRPYYLSLFANFFTSSGECSAGIPLGNIALNGNPCENFIKFFIKNSNLDYVEKQIWSFDQDFTNIKYLIDNKLITDEKRIEFEINNIAINCRKFYDYFLKFTNANSLNFDFLHVYLETIKNDDFNVHYNPSSKEIYFKIDWFNNIKYNGQPIINPSWEPEVIFHEMAHVLMNCIHSDPFDHYNKQIVPFSGAIIEGYANFLSSLLDSKQDGCWAKYAYNEWSDRWSFERDSLIFGQDIIWSSTNYPLNNSDSLHKYDVGMTLFRAIWKLKKILPNINLDGFALNAFLYITGWTSNFEIITIGMIDSITRAISNIQNTSGYNDTELIIKIFFMMRGVNADAKLISATPINHAQSLIQFGDEVLLKNNNIFEKYTDDVITLKRVNDYLFILKKNSLDIYALSNNSINGNPVKYDVTKTPITMSIKNDNNGFNVIIAFSDSSIVSIYFSLGNKRIVEKLIEGSPTSSINQLLLFEQENNQYFAVITHQSIDVYFYEEDIATWVFFRTVKLIDKGILHVRLAIPFSGGILFIADMGMVSRIKYLYIDPNNPDDHNANLIVLDKMLLESSQENILSMLVTEGSSILLGTNNGLIECVVNNHEIVEERSIPYGAAIQSLTLFEEKIYGVTNQNEIISYMIGSNQIIKEHSINQYLEIKTIGTETESVNIIHHREEGDTYRNFIFFSEVEGEIEGKVIIILHDQNDIKIEKNNYSIYKIGFDFINKILNDDNVLILEKGYYAITIMGSNYESIHLSISRIFNDRYYAVE